MRSLRPEQIILLLVFILVPLLNLLVRWLKRGSREQPRPVPTEPRETRVRVIEPALSRESPRQMPPAPPPPPSVIRRAGPLGGRAAVRRAVVAMTILGPCRGLEERPPATPVRRPVR